MDGEAIGTLVVIAFWVISGLLNALGKRKKRQAEPVGEPAPAPAPARQLSPPPPPVPQQSKPKRSLGPDTVGDLLREMLDEVQGKSKAESPAPPWQEPEVLSEHRQAESERSQDWGETHWDNSEHQWSSGEHQGTFGEHTATESEHRGTASEHLASASEHLRGDLRPSRALARVPTAHRRQKGRAGSAIRLALTDRGSLAQALVLKEILGPPVSLRDRSDQGF